MRDEWESRKIRRSDRLTEARELTAEIYGITAQGDFSRVSGLREQIRRAAVSVMSNIAEGFERGARSEFHQFLVISKGACAEVRLQLHVAWDVGYIDQNVFEDLYNSANELSRIIGGLRRPETTTNRNI